MAYFHLTHLSIAASSSSSFSHVDQLAALNCAYVDVCFVPCIIIVMGNSASDMVFWLLGTTVNRNSNSELANYA
jgi:hypothetical protein